MTGLKRGKKIGTEEMWIHSFTENLSCIYYGQTYSNIEENNREQNKRPAILVLKSPEGKIDNKHKM